MIFNLLVSPEKLGFYKSCEVTEIFLINNSDKSILNIYTLIYFSDSEYKGKSTSVTVNDIQYTHVCTCQNCGYSWRNN